MANGEWGCTISSEERESWEAYLDDFNQFVWPIFAERGFSSKDLALQMFIQNQHTQVLRESRELLRQLVLWLCDGDGTEDDEDFDSGG